ncbi:MAG TPA: hypothetical protein ACFCUY_16780 [Xenococcaceae cyanobacterium]|jgi:membrane protein implicated in regulation of membrane protease activity
MKDQILFITKVLVASWLIAVMIKYSERIFAIAPTNFNALVIVFLPFVLLLITLCWSYFQESNQ